MTRLDQYASDTYSQFGEDGVINHIFSVIGIRSRVAVEFGAGDGSSCSNTARLWRDEAWKAVLIEPDPARYEALEGNALPFDTVCVRTSIVPVGPDSIDQILQDHNIAAVDFMSIDVDGDDYFIFQTLASWPRVVAVEFNPTVPPHVDLRQKHLGETFGASLLSLVRLGSARGYRFIGATYCNAFFVIEEEAELFEDYENSPAALFPPDQYTYAVTDFAGHITLCGQPLPWDAKEPYVRPLEASTNVMPPTTSVQWTRRGFEAVWGPALWLSPDGLSVGRLGEVLGRGLHRLVCIDVSSLTADTVAWMQAEAEKANYQALRVGGVLGLISQLPTEIQ